MQRFLRFLKLLSTCSVCVLLLLVSSCKKQGIILNKKSCDKSCNKDSVKKKEAGDVFSPVSESEAKQFAFSKFCSNFSKNFASTDAASHIRDLKGQARDFIEFVRQKEAKLSDIPVPLNAEPLQTYFQQTSSSKNSCNNICNNIILGYKIADMYPKHRDYLLNIVTFYLQEMERLGWKQVAFFDGFEKLIVFKKPSRFCTISIRDISQNSTEKKDLPEILKQAKIIICTQV